jgi:hypothetical protein
VSEINVKAMLQLKANRDYLSFQEYMTLRGQVMAGEHEAAMRGLKTILDRRAKEWCQ